MSGDLITAAGTTAGQFIRIYAVHNDFLFEVILIGTGGIDDQAVRDALGMLGSLKWTF
ncbi:MAG: hypothetical protein ACREOM_14155 [Candidatus Dormibacteraceae bacterium]